MSGIVFKVPQLKVLVPIMKSLPDKLFDLVTDIHGSCVVGADLYQKNFVQELFVTLRFCFPVHETTPKQRKEEPVSTLCQVVCGLVVARPAEAHFLLQQIKAHTENRSGADPYEGMVVACAIGFLDGDNHLSDILTEESLDANDFCEQLPTTLAQLVALVPQGPILPDRLRTMLSSAVAKFVREVALVSAAGVSNLDVGRAVRVKQFLQECDTLVTQLQKAEKPENIITLFADEVAQRVFLHLASHHDRRVAACGILARLCEQGVHK